MSTKTIETCDLCKHSQESGEEKKRQFVFVRIGVSFQSHRDLSPAWNHDVHWCRECADAVGLTLRPEKLKPVVGQPAPPTIDDMLREIIREEVASAGGNS